MDQRKVEAHWADTQRLTYIVIGLWLFFSFAIHFFVSALNKVVILGFPVGFYMAAQGSLVIFVIGLFWFAKRQNEIDEEFGVQEEV